MELEGQAASPASKDGGERRHFTVDEANRALVLVRRVVQDVVTRSAEMMRLRDELQDESLKASSPRFEELQRRAHDLHERLVGLTDELTSVGVEMKDFQSGLVDFPSIRDGREVCLCWKLGEERVAHWHELDAGYRGRRPIGEERN